MTRPRWSSRAGRGGSLNREQTERSAYSLFADMTSGPDMSGGACTFTDPDVFFPEKGGVHLSKLAKMICRGGEYRGEHIPPCPVRAACLRRALEQPAHITHYGTWGGYTAKALCRMRALQAALRRVCDAEAQQGRAA